MWTVHPDGTAVMRFSPTDPNARHAVVPYCVIRKVTDKKTVWHASRFWCRATDNPLSQLVWATYGFENPTDAKRWCEAWNYLRLREPHRRETLVRSVEPNLAGSCGQRYRGILVA